MPFLTKLSSLSVSRESCMTASGFMLVKNLLLFINFLSLLAGIILIAGGAFIQTRGFPDIANLSGTIAAAAIIIGIFVALISFLGCFGAANEKGMLLKTYFALLLLVIVLELGVGAAAYAKKDDLNGLLQDTWKAAAVRANNDTETAMQSSIFTIEKTFKCCGFRNTTDLPVPLDCVEQLQKDMNVTVTVGCFENLRATMSGSLNTIGATGIAMGVMELIGLFFSALLFNRIARKEFKNQSLMNEGWRVNRSKIQHGYQNYQYI